MPEQTSMIPPGARDEKIHRAALAFDKAQRADIRVELIDRIEPKVQVGVQDEAGQPDNDEGW